MRIRHFSTSCFNCAKTVVNNLKGKNVSSQDWLRRQLSDPYVEKAKMMNYRCRSAFKLIEIDDKVHILRPGVVVVDCGAAPGSWTQVAVQRCNADGQVATKPVGAVVGIDKLQVYPIKGAVLLGNLDFTTTMAQEQLKQVLCGKKVDVVLSDMAPNATGVRSLDQENIISLCYSVLRFAAQVSKENATVLLKVWDGGEVPALEKALNMYYKTTKVIKPMSSRSDSSEKFLLGRGFRGIQT